MSTEQLNNEEVHQSNEPVEAATTQENNQAEAKATAVAEEETVESLKLFWNDKYARLAAEFDNYRKRTSKEVSELIKNAGKDVISSMLEILDDYDRAKDQLEKSDNVEALKEGLSLIFNKLTNTLKSRGLEEMKSTGEEFEADYHEAIAEIPAPSPELSNKVVDTVQKGYLLNGKIIRHAKVVVGK